MILKKLTPALAVVMCFVLIHYSAQMLYGYQSQAPSPSDNSGAPTETAPQDAAQLQALVAPIALYPDALVAQILSAATFPDQVAIAAYWLEQNTSLTGSALMQAVDKQSWDPSVKALTQFPSVLDDLSKNLSWTSALGEAFHNQQADVMTAIQTCRAQAKAKGNLKTTSQITVVQQSPQVIEIQPTNPQVVYVPAYNPAIVYGYPYVVPAYVYAPPPSTADVVAAGPHRFWRRDCGGSDDVRRVLRLGIQRMGLRLARNGSGVSRRRVLRQRGLARRLLQFRLSRQLRLQQ